MQRIKNSYSPSLIAELLTTSTEFECLSKNDNYEVSRKFRTIGRGFPSSSSLDDGNGFNDDVHDDCSVPDACYHSTSNYSCYEGSQLPPSIRQYYSLEVSTSPISALSYKDTVANLTKKIDVLKQATGGVYPTIFGSNHIHVTILHDQHGSILQGINIQKLTDSIAYMLRGFFPALRMLGAFSPKTIVRPTSYRYTISDYLFRRSSLNNFCSDRESMFRTTYNQSTSSREIFHVEFRGSDSCQSPELLALQMIVYKAIVLYCVNCLKYDIAPHITESLMQKSVEVTRTIDANSLDLEGLKDIGEELISRLTPLFSILKSPEIPDMLRKFYAKPAYLILGEKGANAWDSVVKYLTGRQREKNEKIRQEMVQAVVSGSVPKAKTLAGFKKNLAQYLRITESEINSLYVMMNREGYNMEFIEGRLYVI